MFLCHEVCQPEHRPSVKALGDGGHAKQTSPHLKSFMASRVAFSARFVSRSSECNLPDHYMELKEMTVACMTCPPLDSRKATTQWFIIMVECVLWIA